MGYAPISRIAVLPDPLDSGTSLGVEENSGDRLPAPPWTYLIFPEQTIPKIGVNAEEGTCIEIDGDVLTLVRGDPAIEVAIGLQIAALRTVDAYAPGDPVALSYDFPGSNPPYSLHLRAPDGAPVSEDVGGTAIKEAAYEQGGMYHYYFEDADGLRSPEQDFFVSFSQVD